MEEIQKKTPARWLSFRLDHVRLRPEHQIAMHQQPMWELSYVISGSGERIIGGSREPFGQGEVVLVVPQMPHQWRFRTDVTDADGCIENITVTFTDELLEQTAGTYPEARPLIERLRQLSGSIRFTRQTASRLAGLLREMSSQPRAVQLFLLLQIVMLMAISTEHEVVGRFQTTPVEQRLHQIEVFICCNYKRNVTLMELAGHVGMNHTSLCKFIRQATGQTFGQYLNAWRLAEAKNLLSQTALTVAEVCYHSGFNDVPHFCRVFKRAENMTPTAYRALHRQV